MLGKWSHRSYVLKTHEDLKPGILFFEKPRFQLNQSLFKRVLLPFPRKITRQHKRFAMDILDVSML